MQSKLIQFNANAVTLLSNVGRSARVDLSPLLTQVNLAQAGIERLEVVARSAAREMNRLGRQRAGGIGRISGGINDASNSLQRFGQQARRASNRAGSLSASFLSLNRVAGFLPRTLSLIGRNLSRLARLFTSFKIVVGSVAALFGTRAFLGLAGDVDNATQAFQNLTASIGTTASEAMRRLQNATRGTVSQLDIMRQTNNAIILGVATSVEQLEALAEAGRRLGRATGRTAAEGFQDLAVGIGRQSRLILDNLGIIVKVEQAYKDFAETVGKSADQLSQAEQRQAFQVAALSAIETALSKVGPDVATFGETVNRVNADIANFAQNLSSSLIPSLNNLIAVFGRSNFEAAAGQLASLLSDLIDSFASSLEGVNFGEFFANAISNVQRFIAVTTLAFNRLRDTVTAVFADLFGGSGDTPFLDRFIDTLGSGLARVIVGLFELAFDLASLFLTRIRPAVLKLVQSVAAALIVEISKGLAELPIIGKPFRAFLQVDDETKRFIDEVNKAREVRGIAPLSDEETALAEARFRIAGESARSEFLQTADVVETRTLDSIKNILDGFKEIGSAFLGEDFSSELDKTLDKIDAARLTTGQRFDIRPEVAARDFQQLLGFLEQVKEGARTGAIELADLENASNRLSAVFRSSANASAAIVEFLKQTGRVSDTSAASIERLTQELSKLPNLERIAAQFRANQERLGEGRTGEAIEQTVREFTALAKAQAASADITTELGRRFVELQTTFDSLDLDIDVRTSFLANLDRLVTEEGGDVLSALRRFETEIRNTVVTSAPEFDFTKGIALSLGDASTQIAEGLTAIFLEAFSDVDTARPSSELINRIQDTLSSEIVASRSIFETAFADFQSSFDEFFQSVDSTQFIAEFANNFVDEIDRSGGSITGAIANVQDVILRSSDEFDLSEEFGATTLQRLEVFSDRFGVALTGLLESLDRDLREAGRTLSEEQFLEEFERRLRLSSGNVASTLNDRRVEIQRNIDNLVRVLQFSQGTEIDVDFLSRLRENIDSGLAEALVAFQTGANAIEDRIRQFRPDIGAGDFVNAFFEETVVALQRSEGDIGDVLGNVNSLIEGALRRIGGADLLAGFRENIEQLVDQDLVLLLDSLRGQIQGTEDVLSRTRVSVDFLDRFRDDVENSLGETGLSLRSGIQNIERTLQSIGEGVDTTAFTGILFADLASNLTFSADAIENQSEKIKNAIQRTIIAIGGEDLFRDVSDQIDKFVTEDLEALPAAFRIAIEEQGRALGTDTGRIEFLDSLNQNLESGFSEALEKVDVGIGFIEDKLSNFARLSGIEIQSGGFFDALFAEIIASFEENQGDIDAVIRNLRLSITNAIEEIGGSELLALLSDQIDSFINDDLAALPGALSEAFSFAGIDLSRVQNEISVLDDIGLQVRSNVANAAVEFERGFRDLEQRVQDQADIQIPEGQLLGKFVDATIEQFNRLGGVASEQGVNINLAIKEALESFVDRDTINRLGADFDFVGDEFEGLFDRIDAALRDGVDIAPIIELIVSLGSTTGLIKTRREELTATTERLIEREKQLAEVNEQLDKQFKAVEKQLGKTRAELELLRDPDLTPADQQVRDLEASLKSLEASIPLDSIRAFVNIFGVQRTFVGTGKETLDRINKTKDALEELRKTAQAVQIEQEKIKFDNFKAQTLSNFDQELLKIKRDLEDLGAADEDPQIIDQRKVDRAIEDLANKAKRQFGQELPDEVLAFLDIARKRIEEIVAEGRKFQLGEEELAFADERQNILASITEEIAAINAEARQLSEDPIAIEVEGIRAGVLAEIEQLRDQFRSIPKDLFDSLEQEAQARLGDLQAALNQLSLAQIVSDFVDQTSRAIGQLNDESRNIQAQIATFGEGRGAADISALQQRQQEIIATGNFDEEQVALLKLQGERQIEAIRQRDRLQATLERMVTLQQTISGAFSAGAQAFIDGADVGAAIAEPLVNALNERLEVLFDKIAADFTKTLQKVTGGAGIFGEAIGGALQGALEIGGVLLARQAQRGAEVRESNIEDIVTQSAAVRGVVAGPTTLPIAESGESLSQSFRVTENILREILVTLQDIELSGGSDISATGFGASGTG
jgi:hypothetical protein